MGFLNRFVACVVVLQCGSRTAYLYYVSPHPLSFFQYTATLFIAAISPFVPFLFAILRCLRFVVLLPFEIIRQAFRLCSICRFVFLSGSPSIVFKFILKQLIGFETIIGKKELADCYCNCVKWFGMRAEA